VIHECLRQRVFVNSIASHLARAIAPTAWYLRSDRVLSFWISLYKENRPKLCLYGEVAQGAETEPKKLKRQEDCEGGIAMNLSPLTAIHMPIIDNQPRLNKVFKIKALFVTKDNYTKYL
jgi:hypothetical protein